MSPLAMSNRTVVHSEFASDPEYRELLEMFDEALPERRQCLTDAFRTGNVRELQTLAHQLKGAGGGFGFPGLTDGAAVLEEACKEGETTHIAAALEQLLAYMQRIAV